MLAIAKDRKQDEKKIKFNFHNVIFAWKKNPKLDKLSVIDFIHSININKKTW